MRRDAHDSSTAVDEPRHCLTGRRAAEPRSRHGGMHVASRTIAPRADSGRHATRPRSTPPSATASKLAVFLSMASPDYLIQK